MCRRDVELSHELSVEIILRTRSRNGESQLSELRIRMSAHCSIIRFECTLLASVIALKLNGLIVRVGCLIADYRIRDVLYSFGVRMIENSEVSSVDPSNLNFYALPRILQELLGSKNISVTFIEFQFPTDSSCEDPLYKVDFQYTTEIEGMRQTVH